MVVSFVIASSGVVCFIVIVKMSTSTIAWLSYSASIIAIIEIRITVITSSSFFMLIVT